MAVAISCKLGLKTLILAAQQEWLDEFYRTYCGNEQEEPMTNAPDIEKFEGRVIVRNQCKTLEDFKSADVCLATYQTFLSEGGKAIISEVSETRAPDGSRTVKVRTHDQLQALKLLFTYHGFTNKENAPKRKTHTEQVQAIQDVLDGKKTIREASLWLELNGVPLPETFRALLTSNLKEEEQEEQQQ
jgi:hypothetical protein